MAPTKSSPRGGISFGAVAAAALAAAVGYGVYVRGLHPAIMFGNMLMLTPFRSTMVSTWDAFNDIDTRIRYEPAGIPEMDAKDYTFERLRAATNNFRKPAIVRGLFKGTTAVERWGEPGYLNEKLGHFNVPTVVNSTYGTKQNDREVMPFSDAFNTIRQGLKNWYLFIPVLTRVQYKGTKNSTQSLKDAVQDMTRVDLEMDRVWPGFATPAHKGYMDTQFIAGYGGPDFENTTGTLWHCAAGNNWFAQAVGSKRWWFFDQENSHLFWPSRGGIAFVTSANPRMHELQHHIPGVRYADLHAGDLLYNPDWTWHSIKNHPGLTIGVPFREMNRTLSFQNNKVFSAMAISNRMFHLVTGIMPVGENA